jgi:hypothetical protein
VQEKGWILALAAGIRHQKLILALALALAPARRNARIPHYMWVCMGLRESCRRARMINLRSRHIDLGSTSLNAQNSPLSNGISHIPKINVSDTYRSGLLPAEITVQSQPVLPMEYEEMETCESLSAPSLNQEASLPSPR